MKTNCGKGKGLEEGGTVQGGSLITSTRILSREGSKKVGGPYHT